MIPILEPPKRDFYSLCMTVALFIFYAITETFFLITLLAHLCSQGLVGMDLLLTWYSNSLLLYFISFDTTLDTTFSFFLLYFLFILVLCNTSSEVYLLRERNRGKEFQSVMEYFFSEH